MIIVPEVNLYVVTFLDLCFLATRLPFCVLLTAKESSCEIMGGRDGAKISGSIIVNASKQIDSCHSAVGQDLVMSISPRKKSSAQKKMLAVQGFRRGDH